MVALAPGRKEHTEDMLAYIANQALGPVGEWPVRIIGGLLLLSATNTAVNGLMSAPVQLNRRGRPEWPRLHEQGGFDTRFRLAIC